MREKRRGREREYEYFFVVPPPSFTGIEEVVFLK
jgi:hypothetical protein